jgi:hypothetical protein
MTQPQTPAPAPWPRSPYEVDLDRWWAAFGGPPPGHAGAPFHLQLSLGGDVVSVPNVTRHAVATAGEINVLPYDNAAGPRQQLADAPVRGRPCELLAHAEAGDVFWGVSHQNFQHRTAASDLESIKQHMSHVRLYAVVADGEAGKAVVPMDFPRSYAFSTRTSEPGIGEANGVINPRAYPSTLYRLVFPADVDAAQQRAWRDNIRSWALLVNKVARFPKDYNGNDRLGTHDLARVREFGHQVLTAFEQDETGRPTRRARQALAWLHDGAQQVYCAEGAVHLALNLGINLPLNATTLTGLHAQDSAATDHGATLQRLLQAGDDAFWNLAFPDAYPPASEGRSEALHSRYTRRVALAAAPPWLAPRNHLAFEPWDAVDMLRHYLRRIVPRDARDAGALDSRSPEVAQAQARLFMDTRPVIDGITQDLGAAGQATIGPLYQQVDAILRRPDDKRDLDAALSDLLATASARLRRDDPGATLFIPPSRVANPEPGDWLTFEEIGQWVHKDFVRERA